MSGSKIFRGLACFSPAVAPTTKATWALNGGKIATTAEEKQQAELFFCCGMSDHLLVKLSLKPIVVIHADWILASSFALYELPLSRFVLDERYESLGRPWPSFPTTSEVSCSQDTLVDLTTTQASPLTSTPVSTKNDPRCSKKRKHASGLTAELAPPLKLTNPDTNGTEYTHPFRTISPIDSGLSLNHTDHQPKRIRAVTWSMEPVKEASTGSHPFIKHVSRQPKNNTFTLRLDENVWNDLQTNKVSGAPYCAPVKSVRQTLSSVPIGRVALLVPGNSYLGREFRCME